MENKNCEGQACVPFFLHENAMNHYNRANKRMLIALIVSCTLLVIGNITLGWMFLSSYNARERGWQDIMDKRIVEVQDAKEEAPPGI